MLRDELHKHEREIARCDPLEHVDLACGAGGVVRVRSAVGHGRMGIEQPFDEVRGGEVCDVQERDACIRTDDEQLRTG